MPRIHQLSLSLVNKIAAGEVIERPASVVKELMENAIDAGATRIDVALEEGGGKLIRVTDNGGGMDREDLILAVAPHATSKITNEDDLFNIQTMGFRGEALASIASVSHLTIRSRPARQIEGHEIIVTDGQAAAPRACAAPVGTTVEVRNLFYNVPARRKFLRQASTELSHATEQVARLSLAYPQVGFQTRHHDRLARDLPPTNDRRSRIGDFYGPEVAACLMSVGREERGLRIEALIAPPDQARATSKWQYLFLNGRFITDRRLGFAIREAYRGLVEHDRYPMAFLFLTAPPSEFDVNVHPTKIEVRWRDAGMVQSQVLAILRETLLSHDLTPRLRSKDWGGSDEPSPGQVRTRQALTDYLRTVDPTQARIEFRLPRFPSVNLRPSIGETFVSSPPAVPSREHEASLLPANDRLAGPSVPFPAMPEAPSGNKDSSSGETVAPPPETPRANDEAADWAACLQPSSLLQVHNTYIVAQTEEGIIIVDQHALHERILFERFRRRMSTGPLEAQRLLQPQPLSLSPRQVQAAEQHGDLLHKLGIELEPFGPDTLAVQAFPSLLHNVEINGFVIDLLDRLVETEGADAEEAHLHAALDMMACKAAVKAGDPLTPEEMQALLAQRHLVERSSNCPHGRPTTLQLSTRDLEKQFKRV